MRISRDLSAIRHRLALSSANVDEVIKRRLLKKTPVARDVHLLYGKKKRSCGISLHSQIIPLTSGFMSQEDEFPETYPFVLPV